MGASDEVVLVALRHHNELLGVGGRERAEEERVRDAEHRRGAPDPDREGQRRRDGKAGVPGQAAESEPEIAPQVVEPRQAPLVTHRLDGRSQCAFLNPRGPCRPFRRGAPSSRVLGCQLEMQPELVLKIAVVATGPQGLPAAMGQHDDRRAAGLASLVWPERAAERRVHPQHVEEVTTDILHRDGSRSAVGRQNLSGYPVRG